jgi:uncharacterized membrane protein HdeD (DUF308 family)
VAWERHEEAQMPQTWNQRPGLGTASGRGRAQPWTVSVPDAPAGLRKARRWLLATGILSIVAGLLAVAVPAIASVTIALFIGWLLVFTGVTMGVAALRVESDTPRWLRLLNAALNLVVGLYVVLFPLDGTLTLTIVLAAWFFASGVLLVAAAWQIRGAPEAWLMGLNGAFSLILGLLIAVDLPSSAGWAIGLLVGINFIFFGVRALIASALMKRLLEDTP